MQLFTINLWLIAEVHMHADAGNISSRLGRFNNMRDLSGPNLCE